MLPFSGMAAAIIVTRSYAPAVLVALTVTISAIWVLADDKRTRRLVQVIQAIHQPQHVPTARWPVVGPPGRTSTGTAGQAPRYCGEGNHWVFPKTRRHDQRQIERAVWAQKTREGDDRGH